MATSDTLSPYARAASDLASLGFHPLPAKAREKGIDIPRWTDYADRKPSDPEMAQWSRRVDANVCAPLGSPAGDGSILVAIDIDVDDYDSIDRIVRVLPPGGMERFGSKGSALLYRAPAGTRSRVYRHAESGKTLIELLAKGRQIILPPSRHPNGNNYRWIGRLMPVSELPLLTEDHLARLAEVAEALGALPAIARAETSSTAVQGAPAASALDDDDADPVKVINRQLNDAALADLDAWLTAMNLPNVRRLPDGRWQGTAWWRPSNSGNSIERRKRNLSFSPKGISDFGDGRQGYTALDVVAANLGLSHDGAFRWLSERVGAFDTLGLPTPDELDASDRRKRRERGEPVARRIIEHADGVLSDEDTGEIIPPVSLTPSPDRDFPDHLTRVPGLLGEIVDYIVDTSRRPDRTLALGSALVCLGTIIGRRDATPTRSGTHLYVVALAGSGVGKDHPQSAGKTLLRVASSEQPGVKLVGASEFMSQSGMIREMQNHPLRASFIDEFGDFLKKVNGPRVPSFERGLKTVLLTTWGRSFDVYETPAWAGEASEEIYSPAHSIFGASTLGKFYEALQGDDRENGFLNRMLLLPTFTKTEAGDPAYDYRDVPDDLAASLRAAYRVRRSPIENNPLMHVVEWESVEAKAAWDAFRLECDRRADDSTYFVRSAEMAGRLATIRAVGCDIEHPYVSLDDIVWGIEVARWSAHRMAEDASAFIADTQVGRDRARIMAKVKGSDGARIAFTKVSQDLGFSSKDLSMLVKDLVDFDELVEEEVAPASGGKKKRYLCAI